MGDTDPALADTPRLSIEVLWSRPPVRPAAGDGPPDRPGQVEEALVQVTDPGLPFHVLLRIRMESTCMTLDSVEVRRIPDGPAVAAETLGTIPVRAYLTLVAYQLGCDDDEPETAAAADGATLRTVARVYREALASSKPRERLAPTAAVARHFAIGRNEANRLVARARRRGDLHPAIHRSPGEVRPEDRIEGSARER